MDKILETFIKNPEAAVVLIKGYISRYKSIAYDLAQEVVEIYKDFSNNIEYPTTVAKIKKNMYDAYVTAGFTKDQALALMINDNIQLMKNVKKITSSSNKKSEDN